MSFQINKDGIPQGINAIDAVVAGLWGHKVDAKSYATPSGDYHTNNWFDSIGYAIHQGMKWTSGWDGVKCRLMSNLTDDLALKTYEEQCEALKYTNEYLKPYFDVIDHFITNGYEPIKVDE